MVKQVVRAIVGRFAGVLRWNEARSLARIARQECRADRLGAFSQTWCEETFSDPSFAEDWSVDDERLATLGIPDMTGGVNKGDRRALYYLVRKLKPLRILEIGTHIGSSTVALALAAKRNRVDGIPTEIVTADIRDVNDPLRRPWEAYGSPSSPRDLVAALGCESFVRFDVGPSVEILARKDESFGLVFLDGSHAASVVYSEVPRALDRLEPAGVIVLHDFFPGGRPLWKGLRPVPGPDLAISRFCAEGANFSALPLGNLPWPTKAGTNTTSLAILIRRS